MFSWGGDSPPEATWSFNELIDWYEKETGNIIGTRITDEGTLEGYEEVIEKFCKFENIKV